MRTYTFKDGFTKEVEGYLEPQTIAKLEEEHGLLYSVNVGNQKVLCGYGDK